MSLSFFFFFFPPERKRLYKTSVLVHRHLSPECSNGDCVLDGSVIRVCPGLPSEGEISGVEAGVSADSVKSQLFDTVQQHPLLWPQRVRTVLPISLVCL